MRIGQHCPKQYEHTYLNQLSYANHLGHSTIGDDLRLSRVTHQTKLLVLVMFSVNWCVCKLCKAYFPHCEANAQGRPEPVHIASQVRFTPVFLGVWR